MSALGDLTAWLISDARRSGDAGAIVDGYAARLVAAGVPLSRANIGQRYANPLLVAWGVVWTPEHSTPYDVTHERIDTVSYVGSPFEYLLEHDRPLHKSLRDLDPARAHASYLELAEAGGTDLYALILYYGDGSRNGCTFVTDHPDGFLPAHIELIQDSSEALACALEPISMRRSTESLLRTYLGDGPSRAVTQGTIRRGERQSLEAVVMFCDLRGFTAMSALWDEARLLEALNGYFDLVVQAVEAEGGDVLKFMGDGVLAVFPITQETDHPTQCRHAVRAADAVLDRLAAVNRERAEAADTPLALGIGLNTGPVTFGNIGSAGRLDFTVIGSAVNLASRVQDLCKTLDQTVLSTHSVARHWPARFTELGAHPLRGVADPVGVFGLKSN